MLSSEEMREIQQEIEKYPTKRAVCVDALKIVQRHRGWVSDTALEEVSVLLEMTPAELDAVATFYNLVFRKPVGRHVILVCDSVSCWVMGGESVMAQLSRLLEIEPGQTTGDGRFTLLPVACLGACDYAPVMMIDEKLYRNLDPEKIERILEGY